MNDLISRRAAIKAVDDLPNCYNGYSDTYDKSCIIGLLEELPTAEKKGKWVPYKDMWECSVCGNVIYAINKADLKVFNAYCGMCGARMEESDE